MLTRHRSKWFWLVFSIGMILGTSIAFEIIFVAFPYVWERINPRIPSIFNTNPEIIVEAPFSMVPQLESFQKGTPVYQVVPELRLVGYLSKVEKHQCARFYLSILKHERVSVMREDSTFEFLHTSPSFIAILGRFFNPARQELLKKQLSEAALRHKGRIREIFKVLTDDLGKRLGNEGMAKQIFSDPVVEKVLLDTIRKEVIDKTDWQKALESIEENESTREVVQLVKSNVKWNRVMGGALEKGLDQGVDDLSKWLVDPETLPQSWSGRVVRGMSAIMKAVFSPVQSSRLFMDGAKKGAVEGGWKSAKKELSFVFQRNKDVILEKGSNSLKEAAKEVELPEKIGSGFEALFGNTSLHDHLKSRYGEPALEAFKQTISWAIRDPMIKNNLTIMGDDIQRICSEWFTSLILNDNRQGPNPLLLTFIREQITRKPEPQILCNCGKGAIVEEGFVYILKE